MRCRNLLICFFMLPVFCFGQNEIRKEIKGKLLTSTTKDMFLEAVYVYNKQSGRGILSDSLGNFKLAVRQGDTVAISALHIDPNEIVIERMHLNDGFFSIAVNLSTEYLEEILLSNRSLTGNLSLDLILLPTESVITTADLGFPAPKITRTKGEQLLASMKTGSSGIPLDILFASLNGELKEIKRRIAVEKKISQDKRILNRLPVSYYTNTLNIKEEDIPHFIDFCQRETDLTYLESLSIEEFAELLNQNLEVYKNTFPKRFEN